MDRLVPSGKVGYIRSRAVRVFISEHVPHLVHDGRQEINSIRGGLPSPAANVWGPSTSVNSESSAGVGSTTSRSRQHRGR